MMLSATTFGLDKIEISSWRCLKMSLWSLRGSLLGRQGIHSAASHEHRSERADSVIRLSIHLFNRRPWLRVVHRSRLSCFLIVATCRSPFTGAGFWQFFFSNAAKPCSIISHLTLPATASSSRLLQLPVVTHSYPDCICRFSGHDDEVIKTSSSISNMG